MLERELEAFGPAQRLAGSDPCIDTKCRDGSLVCQDQQISDAIRRLLTAIQKRERRVSVAGLIRSNMGNAASVWSATVGILRLFLQHF